MVTALEIQHQDDLKKWKNRRTDTWRNGASKKMDYHLVHTKPPPPKMDVIPKTFLQIILAAKQTSGAFKYVPQTATTTFAVSSV